MNDPELEILIERLETGANLTVADFDAVVHALAFLVPGAAAKESAVAERIGSADGAIHVVDDAFPNWVITLRGRANDKDGHWRCTLRESDSRDSDAAIGSGRSPVLAQAILAAVLRLAMILKKD